MCNVRVHYLVLKTRHLHVQVSGSAFCCMGLHLLKQVMGWLPLRFGIGSRRQILAAAFLSSFIVWQLFRVTSYVYTCIRSFVHVYLQVSSL